MATIVGPTASRLSKAEPEGCRGAYSHQCRNFLDETKRTQTAGGTLPVAW